MKSPPKQDQEDDEGGSPNKGRQIAKRSIRAVIDAGTVWWTLGHNDEAATNSVAAIVIIALKAARVFL